MSIQISDCTIRDGGYLTGKNFTVEFVQGVINGLVRAGIDYIETGFLQDTCNGETLVYADSRDIKKYIPAVRGNSMFVGFADNSRYSMEHLDVCDGSSIDCFRIVFAKHECEEALDFAAAAKQKGYHVFVQPMDAPGYSFAERESLIARVNEIRPETLAVVDTFGAMHLDDLYHIFKQMDQLLDKEIKIGLHSHNNRHLSCALAEELVAMAAETDRSVVVDGSLLGMGRGAGNACTETIADFLNRKYGKNYDCGVILETIETYIIPLRQNIQWGYGLPMFICGSLGSHVDNVYYLQEHTDCTSKELFQVISSMDREERTRYGTGYSKTDFSAVRRAYEKLKLKGTQKA